MRVDDFLTLTDCLAKPCLWPRLRFLAAEDGTEVGDWKGFGGLQLRLGGRPRPLYGGKLFSEDRGDALLNRLSKKTGFFGFRQNA